MREVLLRFDSLAPVSVTWGHSDRFIAAIDDASRYAQAISLARTLVVRATNYQGVNVDLTFDLAGARAAFAQLNDGCQTIGM